MVELPREEVAKLDARGGGAPGERGRAVIRVVIALVSCGVFAASAPARVSAPVAWALLGGFLAFSLVVTLCSKMIARRPLLSGAVRLGDALFSLVWIALTGGLDSPWVAGAYVFVASIALRYSPRVTFVVGILSTAGLMIVAFLLGQLPARALDFVVRAGWLLLVPVIAATTARGRERYLASRLRLLELTQEVGHVGTWEWHIEKGTVTWSREIHRIFGIPEGTEPTLEAFMGAVHPDDRADLQRSVDATLRENAPFRVDHRVLRADGSVRWVHCRGRLQHDVEGKPSELVGSSQDVTDRRLMEEHLKSSDRLVSIGTMASGIAHEINNPLSYLSNNVEIVERRLDVPTDLSDPVLANAIAAVKDAAVRVRDIVRGLKTLSRGEDQTRQLVDVARTADMAVAIASHEIGRHARLVRSYADVPPVMANESRLSQVLVNLLVNAAQSFSVDDSAANEIRVELTTEGDDVRIAISDTGAGIDPAMQQRIFDPFFTTKPTGVGTGLGLSICQSIVHELGGTIRVESELGRGSRFEVHLPASRRAESRPISSPPASASRSRRPNDPNDPNESRPSRTRAVRRSRVLVIDDEPRYARSLALLLGEDHDVVLAPSGKAALERIDEEAPFDVILCDLMMPQMTGMEVYARLSEENKARIVFLTGGATTDVARTFLAQPAIRYLEKPIEASVLERLVGGDEESSPASREAQSRNAKRA